MHRFLLFFLSLFLFVSNAYSDISVGFSRRDITPPINTPSAGYVKRQGCGMTGIHDPLLATALSIKTDDHFVVFCSVDHLGFLYEMVQAVSQIVKTTPGLEKCEIFLGSSHTHSGGGAFLNIPVIGCALAGTFDREITAFYIHQTARAIIEATKNMQPAKIGIGYGNAEWLATYRATYPLDQKPVGDIALIKITTPDDRPLACLFNFAVHPTLLTWENRLFSADFVCDARLAIQTRLGHHVIPLFFNGAQADINPAPTFERVKLLPFDKTARMGRALAKEVIKLWENTPTSSNLTLTTKKHTYTFDVKQHKSQPPLPIQSYRSELNLIVLNKKHAFLTIPGELSCIYDRRLKAFGKDLGFTNVSILGLTNDAHGYIITPEAWNHHTAESYKCWGGANYGEEIEEKAKAMMSTAQGRKTLFADEQNTN